VTINKDLGYDIKNWHIDCMNIVPPFEVLKDNTILFGGWEIPILKLISDLNKN